MCEGNIIKFAELECRLFCISVFSHATKKNCFFFRQLALVPLLVYGLSLVFFFVISLSGLFPQLREMEATKSDREIL